jgi:predicted membrane protein
MALAARAPLVAVVTALGNAAVWWVFGLAGRMVIGLGEVVTASVVGVVLGAAALAVLSKLARRPRRAFLVAGVAVLVLYALGPVSAVFAPYREGAETFNLATVLATEVMHLVSGLSILAVFTRSPVLQASR